MQTELVQVAAEFGAAGLIGCMWLLERRAATVRERELHEAHAQLKRERVGLKCVLRTLEANTRAISTMEATQARLAAVLERTGVDAETVAVRRVHSRQA